MLDQRHGLVRQEHRVPATSGRCPQGRQPYHQEEVAADETLFSRYEVIDGRIAVT